MPTPSEIFWNNFRVSDSDLERLYGFVLEKGEPVPARELVMHVIEARVKEEEERRARLSRHATLYQPKLQFEVGQRLIFSALDDAEGTVTAVRAGDNPRLPSFQVVTVLFDHENRTREFAAAYDAPHPLNATRAATSGAADESPSEIFERYGTGLEKALLTRLRDDKEFVVKDHAGLLRGLMTDIQEYHLNLAEAAIEQSNAALSTTELARLLELDNSATKKSTLIFSLENALEHDERFVNVGPRGEERWYLARLQPSEARTLPRILQLPRAATPRVALPPELESLVHELQDEADVDGVLSDSADLRGDAAAGVPIVTIALTYPHRRMGTLPLTPGLRALLPETDNPAMFVTLVDDTLGASTVTRMPTWVVREGDYLAGLRLWFDQHKLSPGALLQLERRPEPLTASIRYQPQRERSLWVRVARVQGGRLTFAQEKRPVAHKYDEDMLILIGDPAAMDGLSASNHAERPLENLLVEIFPELAKLSGAGRVHAKTLYSAVNFLRRVGPRAVFLTLASSPAFSSAGGGYFMLENVRAMAR
jgi:hypothetical protein